MNYKIAKDTIYTIAKKNGYVCLDFQENIGLASYSNGNVRINVYMTTLTVSTCLKHPTKGATQLFRKNVSFNLLNDIFAHPRKHTGKGYYKKQ